MLNDLPSGVFRFIALDVETASADSASICQIGIACVASDNSILTWSTLVNPETEFAPFNVQLHGIDPEIVRAAPTFSQVWPVLAPLLTSHPLVQHSRFDERALKAACAANDLFHPRLSWQDSVTIARNAWPELKGNGGHGLANLKQVLNLEFNHHDAEEDARAAALVVLQAEARIKTPLKALSADKSGFQLSFSF